uniref:Uncharacterized protein n=1 Tax=Anguilla anguilla TaxID=7936 RepID=A0A0E9UC05_ANGAN
MSLDILWSSGWDFEERTVIPGAVPFALSAPLVQQTSAELSATGAGGKISHRASTHSA